MPPIEPLGKQERHLHARRLRDDAQELVNAARRMAEDMIATADRIHPEGIQEENPMGMVADVVNKALTRLQQLSAELGAAKQAAESLKGQVAGLQSQVGAMTEQMKAGVLDPADAQALQELATTLA